jgi:hypothetical protein
MSTVSTRPAATSARIAVGIGVVCVFALLWRVWEFVTMTLVAALGVGCLGVAVWLLGRETPDPADRFVASLLAAPATLLFLGGLAGVVVILLGRLFPVPTGAGIPTATLTIIAHVGVVLGCVVAMLGLATTVRDVLTPTPLARFGRSALICGTVPLAVGAVLAATSVLLRSGPKTSDGTLMSEFVGAILSPGGVHLNLGSFLFVVASAAGAVWLLSVVLPYEDALADAGFGPRERARVDRLVSVTTGLALAAGVAFLPAQYAELALSPAQLRRALGPGTFDLLQSVTTASLFRYLFVGVAVFALGVAASVTLARVVYGRRATTAGWLIPAAAGGLLTVLAAVTAVDLYGWVVDEVATRLPPAVAAGFVDTTGSIRATYGEGAAVIVTLGVLTLLAAGLAYGIRSAISVGYLSPSGGGYSLASSGLLLGTVSVGALGSSAWLVFGGVLAALLVWDVGHHGVALGRTIGPGPTRRGELVHAGASLFVGLAGVVTALLLRAVFQSRTFDPSPARLLALVALTVGLTSLVVAARR